MEKGHFSFRSPEEG